MNAHGPTSNYTQLKEEEKRLEKKVKDLEEEVDKLRQRVGSRPGHEEKTLRNQRDVLVAVAAILYGELDTSRKLAEHEAQQMMPVISSELRRLQNRIHERGGAFEDSYRTNPWRALGETIHNLTKYRVGLYDDDEVGILGSLVVWREELIRQAQQAEGMIEDLLPPNTLSIVKESARWWGRQVHEGLVTDRIKLLVDIDVKELRWDTASTPQANKGDVDEVAIETPKAAHGDTDSKEGHGKSVEISSSDEDADSGDEDSDPEGSSSAEDSESGGEDPDSESDVN